MDDLIPEDDWMLHKILLENGANPDRRDKNGSTLLYRGCKPFHNHLLHLLLRFNADLEMPCLAITTKYANVANLRSIGTAHWTPYAKPGRSHWPELRCIKTQ